MDWKVSTDGGSEYTSRENNRAYDAYKTSRGSWQAIVTYYVLETRDGRTTEEIRPRVMGDYDSMAEAKDACEEHNSAAVINEGTE